MQPLYKGSLFIILSAIGFGFLPIFALYAYQGGTTVSTLLFWRFVIATLLFFLLLVGTRTKWQLSWRQMGALFLLGGVLYTMQSSLYFSAVAYIPASLTALILYLYPIFVALLNFIIEKEPLSRNMLMAMALSLIGMIILLGKPVGAVNMIGVWLALGASLTYSIYVVMSKRVVSSIPPLVTSAFVTLFNTCSLGVIGVTTHTLHLPTQPTAWIPIVGIALFSTVFSVYTFLSGIRLISPMRTSILSTLELVVTLSASALLLQERLGVVQLVGAMLVLLGAVLVVVVRKNPATT